MSSEGDSSKSVLSEPNEKSGNDNTDSSQDSHDVGDTKVDKIVTENDAEKKDDDLPSKEEVEAEDKLSEAKVETDDKTDNDKSQSETEEVESPKEKKGKDVKSEESEEDEKEDDSDKKNEKKDVPLLDQPLEKTGKRERKKCATQNLILRESGTPLGDIPRVDASISRFKNDDLKFSIHKYELKHLKSICEMLDLQKNGTKDDITERIIDFLLEPKDSGKAGGRPKDQRLLKLIIEDIPHMMITLVMKNMPLEQDGIKVFTLFSYECKRKSLKDESSSDDEFQPNQSDGSDEGPRSNKRKRRSQKKESSEEEISEVSRGSSDESDTNNKARAKSTPGKRGRPPVSTKKIPARGKKAKDSSEEDDSDLKDDGSSSEDEPLSKKSKKLTTTNGRF
ncbi:hypothetical protein NQ317_003872 [Molorchus minor]|uniref:SAP domain-containing protein n=1 Tax=Molorchus minor TaxID=1323400 RepID=A0ABQ9JBG4_9CUCU|nr:hypothetical protein NQ317_003872 [Molorchus minor]